MANKKLELDYSLLDEEYEALKKELVELDKLYEKSEGLLDKNSGVRANSLFISSQTSNLISIKDKKLSIYKELIGIKEKKLELEVKQYAANKNNNDEEKGNRIEDLKVLFGMLINSDRNTLINGEENNLPSGEEDINDIDIDSLLDDRLDNNEKIKNEEIEKQKNTNDIDIFKLLEKENLRIVVDQDRNLYIIDEDYNIIEDDLYSDYIDKIVIEIYDNNGFAYDTDGKKYEVVEFME